MSRYIAAYDVTGEKRRRRIRAILSSYGQRVQQSVYEIIVEPHELPGLRVRLGAVLRPHDLFDLYPIDTQSNRTRLRWQRPPNGYDPVIVYDPDELCNR